MFSLTESESLLSLCEITSRVFFPQKSLILLCLSDEGRGQSGWRERGELVGVENGSIMSVGRLTSDVLSVLEERLSEMTDVV